VRLLDAFCGAGGATKGYQRAGFCVTGVDIVAQPHYCGDAFIQSDAIDYIRRHGHEFDAIHASPPCKAHSKLAVVHPDTYHPNFIAPTRQALIATGRPWIIENVPGAPLRPDYKLCGCTFKLPGLQRLRWFETSWQKSHTSPPCCHTGPAVTVAGHGTTGWQYRNGIHFTQEDRKRAMGIDWMNRDELAQAIPPVFTELVGTHLMDQVLTKINKS
jgi:DNA (cytosine-5)-methyltransferase 1